MGGWTMKSIANFQSPQQPLPVVVVVGVPQVIASALRLAAM